MNPDLDVHVGLCGNLTGDGPLEEKSEKKNEYRVTLDKLLLKKKGTYHDHQFKFFSNVLGL